MTRRAKLAGVLGAGLAVLGGGGAAEAACTGFNKVTASVTPAPVVSSYDAFATADQDVTLNVTVTNASTAQCDAAISFQRAVPAAVMSKGTSTLRYDLLNGANTLITSAGYVSLSLPAAANRVDFLNIPAGGVATRSITLRVAKGQVVPSGNYSDTSLTMLLLRLDNLNRPNNSKTATVSQPSATVAAKCSLPKPSATSLDFSTAIAKGRASSGFIQQSVFNGVACTAPAKLTLSGSRLTSAQAPAAPNGFDNFIHWQASGAFGSASASLSTLSASTVTSTSDNGAAVTNGFAFPVSVNLVDNGKPIVAGAYTGTLTVGIDPIP